MYRLVFSVRSELLLQARELWLCVGNTQGKQEVKGISRVFLLLLLLLRERACVKEREREMLTAPAPCPALPLRIHCTGKLLFYIAKYIHERIWLGSVLGRPF